MGIARRTPNAVRYDIAQGLTANQTAQARSNIWVTKKNYIVNGGMQISQENGTTAGTANTYHPVDQTLYTISVSTAVISVAQVASVTPAGSPNRIRATVTTADAAMTTNKYAALRQAIEGLRTADLRFGSAGAKSVTLQFGVKAPAGTYCVCIENATVNRVYVAEYIIAAGEANTDVVKSVTIPGDVTGTWAVDTTIGLYVWFMLMCGPTMQTPAGAWAGSHLLASSNQFNFAGTNGNVFELFDVSLTEGTVAPPFQVPDYASELNLCRRYWQLNTAILEQTVTGAGISVSNSINYGVPLRAPATTQAQFGTAYYTGNLGAIGFASLSIYGTAVAAASAAAGRCFYGALIKSDARL